MRWTIVAARCVSYDEGMPAWYRSWRERHQHPVSFFLHLIAIPLLPWAAVLIVWQLSQGQWGLWYRPVALLGISYLMQWIGHRIEGNDMGEVILIKRGLKRPFVAVSPRYGGDRAQRESALP